MRTYIKRAVVVLSVALLATGCGSVAGPGDSKWRSIGNGTYAVCDRGNMVYSSNGGGLAVVYNHEECTGGN